MLPGLQQWTPVCLSLVTIWLMVVGSVTPTHVFLGRWHRGQLRRDFHFERMITQQGHSSWSAQPSGFDALPEEQCPDNANKKLTIDYWPQKLDNFGSDEKRTWQQHYQVNDQFFTSAKNDSPVIFLNIGGEGPISNKWVCYENYTYMQLAKTHGARVIQLEHRFFGSNKEIPDMTVDSLRFLTTEQALADLNTFIRGYSKKQEWKKPKWVVFGGSYPGTMAALFRKVYANATQGGISSSSVLYPKLDLYEYAQQMEVVIKATSVGDLSNCYTETKNAYALLAQKLVTEAGRSEVTRSLNLKTPLSSNLKDLQTVQFRIFDAFQGIIQYTYDARDANTQEKLTVRALCKLMVSQKDPIARLGDVFYLAHEGEEDNKQMDPSYENMIAPWKNTTNAGSKDGYRGWMWLSCNEFGWLQSTSNNGMFGDAVPISYLLQMCYDLFENRLNASLIEDNVRASLKSVGYPWEFNATNVVLPAGGYDPWSVLRSNVTNNETHTFSHLTPGAAHCSDMYPSYPNEPSGLKETRDLVGREVAYYLSQPSVFDSSFGGVGMSGSLVSTLFIPICLFLLAIF